jgi:4,5-dihydroxyphthalate decarboxylase
MTRVTRRRFLGTASAAAAVVAAPSVTRATTQRPALRLTGANYVRFMPLATGDLKPADLDLTWIRGDRNEMIRRATADPQVDGGESSMAQHIVRVDAGDRSLVAVPVFPLRNFTARDLYTRRGSALAPNKLSGKRIGIYSWAASGAVWYRHLVRHLGNDYASIRWIVGGADTAAVPAQVVALPANVTPSPTRSLSDLLLAGEIDAFFAPLPPKVYAPPNGPIVRLVADFRSVEQQYFARTRCYPPQHAIVIRRAVWERDPSVGARLVSIFDACDREFHAAQRLYPYNSPWLIGDIETAELAMGADYHAHGLEKNRHAVDTFCQGAFDDGLTKRRITVDEFFAEFVAAARSTSGPGS